MKITGAEFKEFYDHHWPDADYYHDDGPETHAEDGSWLLADDEALDADSAGYIAWQGDGPDPRGTIDCSMAGYIRRWRRARDTEVIVVRVPKARAEEVRKALKAFGASLAHDARVSRA